MFEEENRRNEKQSSKASADGQLSVSNKSSYEDSLDDVSIDLESLGEKDSIDEVPSYDGSICSSGEKSSSKSIESSSGTSISSANSAVEMSNSTSSQSTPYTSVSSSDYEKESSYSTSSQSTPYTSVSSSDSERESSCSTSSQSTSYSSIIYGDFIRSLQNVPSLKSSSDKSISMGSFSSKKPVSKQSQSTSDTSFVYESSSGEESALSLFQITSADDSIDGQYPEENSISQPPKSIPDKSGSFTSRSQPLSAGDDKEIEAEMDLPLSVAEDTSSTWSTPEPSRDQRNTREINDGYQNPISRFLESKDTLDPAGLAVSSDNSVSEVNKLKERTFGLIQDNVSMSNYYLESSVTSTNEDSIEGCASNSILNNEDKSKKLKRHSIQRLSMPRSVISQSDESNGILDEAFAVGSEEGEQSSDEELETSILNRISPSQCLQLLSSDEDYQAEIAASDCTTHISEEEPHISNQSESRSGDSEAANLTYIPDQFNIQPFQKSECMDIEIDELETSEAKGASDHESSSFRNQPSSSFVDDFRVKVNQSIATGAERGQISRGRQQIFSEERGLQRQRSRCRTSTFKNVGFDNILVRAHVISSPESKSSQDEAEELFLGPRSASNSLLGQPRSSFIANHRTDSSRSTSNSRRQVQMSNGGDRPSRERSRSRNPCVSFIDDVIEEVSENEEYNAAEDRITHIEDDLLVLQPLSTEDQDHEMRVEDIYPDPIGDDSPSSEIECLRSQTVNERQSQRYRIFSDSDTSRDEELRQSFVEILSPERTPGPVFRPCPWSPSILSLSTPTGSWYGDEPFPEHFPSFSTPSSTSSRDRGSPEDVQSFILPLEEQPQLVTSNQQSFESFTPSPQRSSPQHSNFSLFEEQPLTMPAEVLNTPPRYLSDGELMNGLSPFESIFEQPRRVSIKKKQFSKLNTSSQHSNSQKLRHQLIPLPSFREHFSPGSSNHQSCASSDTPPQLSNSHELRQRLNPSSSFRENPSPVSSNKQSSVSSNTSPQHSKSQKLRHQLNPFLSFREHPSAIASIYQSYTSLDTPSQHSNSQELNRKLNPLPSFREHSSPVSSNHQSYVSSDTSPQRSISRELIYQLNPVSSFRGHPSLGSSNHQSHASSDTPPQYSDNQELRQQLIPSSSFREQPSPESSNDQSVSSNTSPYHSNIQKLRHQLNPSSSFREQNLPASSNQQSSTSSDTLLQYSNGQELRKQNPLPIIGEPLSQVTPYRLFDDSLNILPRNSNNRESSRPCSPLLMFSEQSLRESSDQQSSLPSNTPSKHSSTQEVRQEFYPPPSFEEQSKQVTNRQSIASLVSNSPKSSPIRNSLLYGNLTSQGSTKQRSIAKLNTRSHHQSHQESERQCNIILNDGSSITDQQKVPAEEYLSPNSNAQISDTSHRNSLINRPIRSKRRQIKTDKASNIQKRSSCQKPTCTSKQQTTKFDSSIKGSVKSLKSVVRNPSISSSEIHTVITHPPVKSKASGKPVRAKKLRSQPSSTKRKSNKMLQKSVSKTQHHQISISRSSSINNSTTKHSAQEQTSTTATIKKAASTLNMAAAQHLELSTIQHEAVISVPRHPTITSVVARQQSASLTERQQSASKATFHKPTSTISRQQSSNGEQTISTVTHYQSVSTTQMQSKSILKSKRERKACATNQVIASQVKQVASRITTRSRSVIQQSTSTFSQDISVLNEITIPSGTKHASTYQTRSESKKI